MPFDRRHPGPEHDPGDGRSELSLPLVGGVQGDAAEDDDGVGVVHAPDEVGVVGAEASLERGSGIRQVPELQELAAGASPGSEPATSGTRICSIPRPWSPKSPDMRDRSATASSSSGGRFRPRCFRSEWARCSVSSARLVRVQQLSTYAIMASTSSSRLGGPCSAASARGRIS